MTYDKSAVSLLESGEQRYIKAIIYISFLSCCKISCLAFAKRLSVVLLMWLQSRPDKSVEYSLAYLRPEVTVCSWQGVKAHFLSECTCCTQRWESESFTQQRKIINKQQNMLHLCWIDNHMIIGKCQRCINQIQNSYCSSTSLQGNLSCCVQ